MADNESKSKGSAFVTSCGLMYEISEAGGDGSAVMSLQESKPRTGVCSNCRESMTGFSCRNVSEWVLKQLCAVRISDYICAGLRTNCALYAVAMW